MYARRAMVVDRGLHGDARRTAAKQRAALTTVAAMRASDQLPSRLGASPARPRRRDRHGRGFRADLIPPHLPGYLTRRARFDADAADAAQAALERFPRRLEHVRVHVEEVPPPITAGRGAAEIPLGRCIPADRTSPPRVILYRRPIETRAQGPEDRLRMVRQVLSEQFGVLLGMAAEDVDPDAWL